MKKTSTTTIYKSTKEGKVRLTMTLDPRKGTDKDMPVCVRVRIGNLQRYFIMPEERYTAEEFASIINEDNRKLGKKRKEFDDFFDRIKRETKRLVEEGEYSPLELLEKITAKINGLKEEEEAKGMTIFDVWEQLLKELEDANRIGTRKSYLDSLKRFRKDMGEKVPNSSINQQLVDRWVAKMQNPKEGKTMSQIIDEISPYSNSGEINFKIELKQEAMDAVKNHFMQIEKPERFLDFDGYRLDYLDWWLNIRPSNTEPYLRFLCEAKSEEKLQELISMVKAIVTTFA
jgi:hypothetical protein